LALLGAPLAIELIHARKLRAYGHVGAVGSRPWSKFSPATLRERGPAVRSASLLERRGFEPAVLFDLFPPWQRGPRRAVFGPNSLGRSLGEHCSDWLQRSDPAETLSLS
jgi:hypothetical protein